MHWCPGNAHNKRRPASAGTLGERGRGGPSAQVLTLQIIRAIKLLPNQKWERMTGKKRLKGHGPGHTQCTWLHMDQRLCCSQIISTIMLPETCRMNSWSKTSDSLPRPAISPDLSPSECVWDQLKRWLQQWLHPPKTVQSLCHAVVQDWETIPQ